MSLEQEALLALTTKGIHLEDLPNGSFIARAVGRDKSKVFEIAVVVAPLSAVLCEIKGLTTKPTREQVRLLRQELKLRGYRYYKCVRIRKGVAKGYIRKL